MRLVPHTLVLTHAVEHHGKRLSIDLSLLLIESFNKIISITFCLLLKSHQINSSILFVLYCFIVKKRSF